MAQEIRELEENGTWTLTDLPPNKKATGLKWVTRSNSTWMEQSNITGLVLLQKDIPTKTALIFTILVLLLPNLSLVDVSFLPLLYGVGLFINLT